MAVPFFDLTRQYAGLQDEVGAAIARVLETQHFIMGPEVAAFEEELAAYVGAPRAIGVASGTDALLLPLMALDAQPGDEVIVPAFTFFATAGAVWNAGFRPVFCDVDPATFDVTRATLEAAWTERTRAVVPVHLFGQMAPMTEIMALAEERGAVVIEDVAQSIGATQEYEGSVRSAGSIGHVGTFSFFPTKNLGGFGDAGAVSATDEDLGHRVSLLRVHGGRRMYHHEYVGTNSRLDALQAAILRTKLPHLSGWIEARQANASRYRGLLAGLEALDLPKVRSGNVHTYNQFTIRTDRRDELRESLSERGIGSSVYYPVALHLQACFSELGYSAGQFPVSEGLCGRVMSLPVFPELRVEEVEEVAAAIRSFFGSTAA